LGVPASNRYACELASCSWRSTACVVVERLEPMFCPPVLEREVPGDAEQEGPQRPARRIESLRVSQQSHEYVLGDVLRRGRRARHAPGEPVDGILVLVEDGLKLGVGHVAC
jgi:hypothetical protein